MRKSDSIKELKKHFINSYLCIGATSIHALLPLIHLITTPVFSKGSDTPACGVAR